MKNHQTVVRLIACAVFKPALDFLALKERYPHLKITYLPSYLHLKPQELQKQLLKEIIKARKGGERILCLYGDCFPDIEEFCRRHEAVKVPGHYCYEMLLGPDRFKQFLDETAGTYFLEQDVIQNFEAYCMNPLELKDKEMRRYCFEHYKRVLYIKQPDDVDLESKACDIADFLDLHMDASDADYSYLESRLAELI